MRGERITWAWLAGAALPLILPSALPSGVAPLIALGAVVLGVGAGALRPSMLALGVVWTSLAVDDGLARRGAQATGTSASITGTVVGLPEFWPGATQFRFRPDRSPFIADGTLLSLRWHDGPRGANALRPDAGERWRLQVSLKSTRGRLNFSGEDAEGQTFSRGITALGTVRSGERLAPRHAGWGISSWRGHTRAALIRQLGHRTGSELVLALAIADRSGITPNDRAAIRRTGTGHLLAISGLHVGLVALMAYWLARVLLFAWPPGKGAGNAHLAALWLGLAGACIYAGLAGFGTSTGRAVLMLAAWVVVRSRGRSSTLGSVLTLALCLLLFVQPLALLQAGTWLSFGAVAALGVMFQPRTAALGPVRSLLWAQTAIMLLIAPLAAGFFGSLSPGALLVNLFAIPYISLVTLPLVLAGLLSLALAPTLAEWPLAMAAGSAQWALAGLHVMDAALGRFELRIPAGGWLAIAPAILAGLVLTLPRGLPARFLALLLYLPLLLGNSRPPPHGVYRLELLDVGQGLAALVRTREHLLLYDSGPGQAGRWDLVDRVLLPAVARHGRQRPDWVLISHGDADHAGGLARLSEVMGGRRIMANLRSAPHSGCFDDMAWNWDGVRFEVLHPSPYLPYLGNDSSCVLAIGTGAARSLLPGDVGRTVEQRLARTGQGGFSLVIAAHHGSRTSSSAAFLGWARPRLMLAATGAHNRFGFPHAETVVAARRAGARLSSTAACGAMLWEWRAGGEAVLRSARRERPAPWRWAAHRDCPRVPADPAAPP